jgi:hypothetical protein
MALSNFIYVTLCVLHYLTDSMVICDVAVTNRHIKRTNISEISLDGGQ